MSIYVSICAPGWQFDVIETRTKTLGMQNLFLLLNMRNILQGQNPTWLHGYYGDDLPCNHDYEIFQPAQGN